jgi:hypothetical protein
VIKDMRESLTYTEIKEEFSGEWILLENPETTRELNIKRAKVLWHSKDRDEVYKKGREIKPKHSAILYLGDIPKDIAVVL